MNLDGVVFQLLQNGLNAAQLRQQVYANNIANVDTPGFQRQDVVFEDLLQYLLGPDPGREGAGSPSAADWTAALRVSPQVVTDRVSVEDNNGNNVDIDAEMAKLAQNQIRYNTLVEDVRMRLDRLKTAIEG
ncbi:flagellar basal body rod protein FlgB [Alicyclobacillus macrosporangiidus]|uniref:flagellar basal body rod protein FlgB n=1 Tax=Alicyclobacillus macrosporangiidus TaxID=392015 RepID=UPI000941FDE9|nr:flagellar basal body rod protein FlgB [Alicyclobacillus macrosporangiidus]